MGHCEATADQKIQFSAGTEKVGNMKMMMMMMMMIMMKMKMSAM